jgi:signal-transduction protein with cAMP-binding, CBS, and nucleotidyltransferase domain
VTKNESEANQNSDSRSRAGTTSAGTTSEADLFDEQLRYLECASCLIFDRGTPVIRVLQRMREKRAGGTLIVDEKDSSRLVGIFTARDILDQIAGQKIDPADTVEAYMTPSPQALTIDDTVGSAIRLLTEGGYRHVPLVDAENQVQGMVSVRDIVEFISEHFPEEVYNLPPIIDQRPATQEGG